MVGLIWFVFGHFYNFQAFNPLADLGGLVTPSLSRINEVLQKAYTNVHELGSEAAAWLICILYKQVILFDLDRQFMGESFHNLSLNKTHIYHKNHVCNDF